MQASGTLAVSSEEQLYLFYPLKHNTENYNNRPNSSKSVFPAPQKEIKNGHFVFLDYGNCIIYEYKQPNIFGYTCQTGFLTFQRTVLDVKWFPQLKSI